MTDQATSRESCIGALQHAAERLGHPPTESDYRELGLTPSKTAIRTTFGTWNDALEAAGFDPRPSSREIPEERLLRALRETAKRVDGHLTEDAYMRQRDDSAPAAMTIHNRFESWNEALDRSGVE